MGEVLRDLAWERVPETLPPLRHKDAQMEKYVDLAKSMNMVNAVIISPKDVVFDIRALLKCRWGCDDYFQESIKCHAGGQPSKSEWR